MHLGITKERIVKNKTKQNKKPKTPTTITTTTRTKKTCLELVTFYKEQRLILPETSLEMKENIKEKRFYEIGK